MLLPTRHRRLLAGFLLFALMLQALLPAMAGAVSDRSERWIEVCASSGVKWVQLDTQASAADHSADGHCMLCAATGALPDFDARRYLRPQGAETRTTPLALAAPPAFPGHALRSRAPPVFS